MCDGYSADECLEDEQDAVSECRVPEGYLEDVLFLISRKGASFTGHCHEGTGIAIKVSGAPGEDERTVRVTVGVPIFGANKGSKEFSIDVKFYELAEVIGEDADETFVEFFVRKTDPEEYWEFIVNPDSLTSGFGKLCEFYESLDVPYWHVGMVEDHASEIWYLCHDSEEECVADLMEQRREGMMFIDYDVGIAIDDLVKRMVSETRRRSLGASRIQKNWRAMSSSPYTAVGNRVITRRFYS